MPNTSPPRSNRLPRDVQRLVSLAESLAQSGSRLEDVYWEGLLANQLDKLLIGKKNKSIEAALEHLIAGNVEAYEILVEQAETQSESTQLQVADKPYDVLLICAPVVAWTRYQLPQSFALGDQLQAAQRLLQQHILAEGAQVALVPELVCFDQMPQSFQETLEWTQRLGKQALGQRVDPLVIKPINNMEGMLADARFLIAAVAVPRGGCLFRWQNDGAEAPTRAQCFEDWVRDASNLISPMFTGCTVEYLHPDAYYVNSREADRRIRPLALKAAVTWLQTAAGLPGDSLRATIAGAGESIIEEYRIGFSTRQSTEVIYGCIWPILSKDEAVSDSIDNDETAVPEEILSLLRELGVSDVRRLPGLHTAEFCDDCGAPYFPNPLGEMLHPELPEEIDINPLNFH